MLLHAQANIMIQQSFGFVADGDKDLNACNLMCLALRMQQQHSHLHEFGSCCTGAALDCEEDGLSCYWHCLGAEHSDSNSGM